MLVLKVAEEIACCPHTQCKLEITSPLVTQVFEFWKSTDIYMGEVMVNEDYGAHWASLAKSCNTGLRRHIAYIHYLPHIVHIHNAKLKITSPLYLKGASEC